jgi:Tfp pilus assembly protein PilF
LLNFLRGGNFVVTETNTNAVRHRFQPGLPSWAQTERFAAAVLAVTLLSSRMPTVGQEARSKPVPSASGQTNAIDTDFERLQALDDAAQAEVERWTHQSRGTGTNQSEKAIADLNRRVHERLEPVRKAYDEFLKKHPNYVQARLTYGNFLNDLGEESAAQEQWEKALSLDPKNPDALNNLAGRYSEIGPPEKAFEYYGKAIELNPTSAVYQVNFGDTLYVRRKAAMGFYHLDEDQVYAKALAHYSNAARLDATNYAFASKAAETYYTLKPFPAENALKAWTNALLRTHSEPERQEICIHLARVNMLAGHYTEARKILAGVTNEQCLKLKSNLLEALRTRESEKR